MGIRMVLPFHSIPPSNVRALRCCFCQETFFSPPSLAARALASKQMQCWERIWFKSLLLLSEAKVLHSRGLCGAGEGSVVSGGCMNSGASLWAAQGRAGQVCNLLLSLLPAPQESHHSIQSSPQNDFWILVIHG